MVKADAALIGGTGIGEILRAHPGRAVMVPTPFGPMRGWLQDRQGQRVVVVARHAAGHKTPPHGIGYRAIAEGLRLMGVRRCLATAAVGSLRVDWAPGTLAVVTDFIDATGRQVTGFNRTVNHVDMSQCFAGSAAIGAALKELGLPHADRSVYVGMDGPRYETAAEIRMLQMLGGDVVGMTATSEAIAMAEAGVEYGLISVVTNLGCGLDPEGIDHGAVTDVMKERGADVVRALELAVSPAMLANA